MPWLLSQLLTDRQSLADCSLTPFQRAHHCPFETLANQDVCLNCQAPFTAITLVIYLFD